MKLRRVVGSFIRMPWIPLLDSITDACEDGANHLGPLSFLVRPCCKPAIALAWFYGLSKVRVASSAIIEQVKVAYYDPHEEKVRTWYARWPTRVVVASGLVAVAYAATFYIYPSAVRPYVSMSWLVVEDDGHGHSSYVSTVTKVDWATGEKREFTLVSKSLIKCVARQSEVVVWVLGTLLRIPTKRFLPIWFASQFASPLAEGMGERGGNFALWISIGAVLGKMFCLYPSDKERYLGALGSMVALIVTSIMLPTTKKVGRTETVVSTCTFLFVELAARYIIYSLKAKKALIRKFFCKKEKNKNKPGGSKKPNILIRAWRYVTYDEETSLSSSWPEFSYPSYVEWVGLAAAWLSMGLAIDGV